MDNTIPNTKTANWNEISPEHLEEMNNFAVTPITRIIYAMSLLSDVMDKDMIGEERNKHINDVKIIIKNYLISNEPQLCETQPTVYPPVYPHKILNDLNKEIKDLETVRDKLHHEIMPRRVAVENLIEQRPTYYPTLKRI